MGKTNAVTNETMEALGLFSKLDLSGGTCHVCGWKLVRNLAIEKEWCPNEKCKFYDFRFNIPYTRGNVKGEEK